MDNTTPNHDQDDPNELRFRNDFMNDSGVENCSFLRNEALCSIKPPRLLLNDVPLDITINRTLFDQSENEFDENIVNATTSSGIGSEINSDKNISVYNGTVASEADQLVNFSGDEIFEDDNIGTNMGSSLLNRALCFVKPPKFTLNDVSFDQPEPDSSSDANGIDQMVAGTSKTFSKYSIEDGVIVIESDDEVDSIDTKLEQFLEAYTPNLNGTRLKALHHLTIEAVNGEKQISRKHSISLSSDRPSINRPLSTDVNYVTEVIDLSGDDDLFNTTLERVNNILGDYKPAISEARLEKLHEISLQVVNVEKRKSPKRTMSLFTETPDSIAERQRRRAPKRTISVEQFN